jgi:hypothetical protein
LKKSLVGGETCHDSGGSHYSWVGKGWDKLGTLEEILEEWRWEAEVDEEGNITDIQFAGEKYGDEEALFSALAPFVDSGSFIEMVGEEGDHWRWCFTEGTLVEEIGSVVFHKGEIDLSGVGEEQLADFKKEWEAHVVTGASTVSSEEKKELVYLREDEELRMYKNMLISLLQRSNSHGETFTMEELNQKEFTLGRKHFPAGSVQILVTKWVEGED